MFLGRHVMSLTGKISNRDNACHWLNECKVAFYCLQKHHLALLHDKHDETESTRLLCIIFVLQNFELSGEDMSLLTMYRTDAIVKTTWPEMKVSIVKSYMNYWTNN